MGTMFQNSERGRVFRSKRGEVTKYCKLFCRMGGTTEIRVLFTFSRFIINEFVLGVGSTFMIDFAAE
jgi:hypothetical protein